MRDQWWGRWGSVPLLSALLCGCSCEALYGFDSARPSLAADDTFDVDPECPDLPLDPSGVALVPRVVTLSGRRAKTGLGAEGVPVSVRIGRCEEIGNADGAAGAAGATGVAGAAGVEGASGSHVVPGPTCVGGLQPLEQPQRAAFELDAVEGRGCRQRSPLRLDCTLDPAGEAAFEVVGQLLDDGLSLTGYLPVCVTPLELDVELGPSAPKFLTEVGVIPRFGSSRVALAVVELKDEESAPVVPSGNCASLVNCDRATARAVFQAGIVSPDIPSGEVQKSDFLQVTRGIELMADLAVLSSPTGEQPFLSIDPKCSPTTSDAGTSDAGGQASAGDGGALATASGNSIPLSIEQGQSATQVFYLCAPGDPSSNEVTPQLTDANSDAGSNSPAPILRSARVDLPAVTQSYSAEPIADQWVLFMQDCGGGPEPATQSSVRIQSPLSVSGDQIVIQCGATEADAAVNPPDASGGSDAGSLPEASPGDAGVCGPITLELLPGGTCDLIVGN